MGDIKIDAAAGGYAVGDVCNLLKKLSDRTQNDTSSDSVSSCVAKNNCPLENYLNNLTGSSLLHSVSGAVNRRTENEPGNTVHTEGFKRRSSINGENRKKVKVDLGDKKQCETDVAKPTSSHHKLGSNTGKHLAIEKALRFCQCLKSGKRYQSLHEIEDGGSELEEDGGRQNETDKGYGIDCPSDNVKSGDVSDNSCLLFVGNIPIGTKKKAVINSLGLSKTEWFKIFFRSLPVDDKFRRNKRNGILAGKFSSYATSHNAYIRLSSKNVLKNLINAERKFTINDNVLRLDKSRSRHKFSLYQPKKTLFLGGLNSSITENNIREVLENDLSLKVKAVRIVRDNVSGKSKGFGFVCLRHHNEAKKVLRDAKSIEIEGVHVRVSKPMTEEEHAEKKQRVVQKRKRMTVKRQNSAH